MKAVLAGRRLVSDVSGVSFTRAQWRHDSQAPRSQQGHRTPCVGRKWKNAVARMRNGRYCCLSVIDSDTEKRSGIS